MRTCGGNEPGDGIGGASRESKLGQGGVPRRQAGRRQWPHPLHMSLTEFESAAVVVGSSELQEAVTVYSVLCEHDGAAADHSEQWAVPLPICTGTDKGRRYRPCKLGYHVHPLQRAMRDAAMQQLGLVCTFERAPSCQGQVS